MPVHVVELQAGHLPGPQAQAHQQRQDGVVAPPDHATLITAGKQTVHLGGRKPPRQRALSPPGDAGHRRRQRRRGDARHVQVAQQRTQRHHQILRRSNAPPGALAPHKPGDLRGAQLRKVQAVHPGLRHQEQAGDVGVVGDGALGQPPLADQVAVIGRKQPRNRALRDPGDRYWHHLDAAQVVEQQRHAPRRHPRLVACGVSCVQELLHTLWCELAGRQPFTLKPAAHMVEQPEPLPHRRRRVAPTGELGRKARRIGRQRSPHYLDPAWC